MCRFTLYLGPPVQLSALLFEPEHSLIEQSAHCQERAEAVNGDGFGVGWYAPELSEDPAVFRSIMPAWNNRNLASLSRVVSSPCVLAHVRAATSRSRVNESNCHPFRFDRYLFLHNGDVNGFQEVRRPLLRSLCDEAFHSIGGSTDSEHVFALVIDELLRLEHADPALRLALALQGAVRRILELVREHAGSPPCLLNLALCDGENAVVSRFTANSSHSPESLYLHRGRFPLASAGDDHDGTPGESAFVVSSERLGDDPGWSIIPANHLVIGKRHGEALVLPFDLDESATGAA